MRTAGIAVLLAAMAGGAIHVIGAQSPTPTPGAAPTVAPSPVFRPPLSLSECLSLIDRSRNFIAPTGDRTAAPTVAPRDITRMVRSATNYLIFRDDLHSTLSDYQWVLLADGKVQDDDGKPDRDLYEFDPPVKSISAISLESQGGDVSVHLVRVIDEKDNERQRFPSSGEPFMLQHSLPRRHVLHLWKRTTISRIEIDYANTAPRPGSVPRVVIMGGITEQREYVKTAIYHLQQATGALESGDYVGARADLHEARANIARYLELNPG